MSFSGKIRHYDITALLTDRIAKTGKQAPHHKVKFLTDRIMETAKELHHYPGCENLADEWLGIIMGEPIAQIVKEQPVIKAQIFKDPLRIERWKLLTLLNKHNETQGFMKGLKGIKQRIITVDGEEFKSFDYVPINPKHTHQKTIHYSRTTGCGLYVTKNLKTAGNYKEITCPDCLEKIANKLRSQLKWIEEEITFQTKTPNIKTKQSIIEDKRITKVLKEIRRKH
jgi:hypothetical protein